MSFPSGAPGGYPGQGPQHPPQGFPPAQGPGGGPKLALPQILQLATVGLGLLNFFLGFATIVESGPSFFDSASVVPGLFLLSGLFAAQTLIGRGERRAGIGPAAFAVTGALTVLFFTFSTSADLGIGSILLIVFGLVQAIAAVVSYLAEVGVLTLPVPGANRMPPGYGQPGGYNPPSGSFGQQPMGQPQQFGQPQHPGPGPTMQFGSPQQQQGPYGGQGGQFGSPQGGPHTPPPGFPQQD